MILLIALLLFPRFRRAGEFGLGIAEFGRRFEPVGVERVGVRVLVRVEFEGVESWQRVLGSLLFAGIVVAGQRLLVAFPFLGGFQEGLPFGIGNVGLLA